MSVAQLVAASSPSLLDGAVSASRLPPTQRPDARLSVLDLTEFFGETSGGIRTYLLEKARYVRSTSRLRQILVVPGEQDALTEIDGVRCYRLRGPRIPRQHPYRFMLATRSTSRIIEHERPDIIEVGSTMLVPWIACGAARARRVPLVGFHHSHLPGLFARTRHRTLRRIAVGGAWHYVKALDRLFARTIVASRFLAEELARAGIERVVRIPLGVELSLFHPARRDRADRVRRTLGLDHEPLAVYAGRLAAEKELDVLVDAWSMVEKELPAHLLIVGDGPMRERLRDRARSRRIRFVPFEGERDALADILAAADICVAPGRVETFGLAALEAMASGTPVLSADEGGVAEQVADSGAGAVFPSGSASGLARAALGLLTADRAALARRARDFAEREHAWPVVFERLFAMYDEVIAEQRA